MGDGGGDVHDVTAFSGASGDASPLPPRHLSACRQVSARTVPVTPDACLGHDGGFFSPSPSVRALGVGLRYIGFRQSLLSLGMQICLVPKIVQRKQPLKLFRPRSPPAGWKYSSHQRPFQRRPDTSEFQDLKISVLPEQLISLLCFQ